MNNNSERIVPKYEIFEDFIAELFSSANYEIARNVMVNNNAKFITNPKHEIDIVAKQENDHYGIEVRYITNYIASFDRVMKSADNIKRASEALGLKPVIVVASIFGEQALEEAEQFGIIVLDIRHLLFITAYNQEQREKLLSLIPYVIDDIEPIESPINLSWLEHSSLAKPSILERLDACPKGKKDFRTYEEICYELLKKVFLNDLVLWKTQESSNDGLYRFDVIFRIKDYQN